MANKVTFDYSKTAEYISEGEITAMKRIAEDAKKLLLSREGEGNDFLGWIDLPVDYDKESGGKDTERFRCPACYRYWWFISWSQSSQ